jgi:ferredoxin
MPTITVTLRDGQVRTIDGRTGHSLMENLRDNGVDEIIALCGGCMSCATCHVHVDDEWLDSLPPMSDDEGDLLDTSSARTANSRLSCQIPLTERLDGLAVTVAPED